MSKCDVAFNLIVAVSDNDGKPGLEYGGSRIELSLGLAACGVAIMLNSGGNGCP